MKIQLVFVTFLVCSLLGELFGQVVKDSNDALLENTTPGPERRVAMYDPECENGPDNENILYSYYRIRYPRTSSEFSFRKSALPNEHMQYPQLLAKKLYPCHFNSFLGSGHYNYPQSGSRVRLNKHGCSNGFGPYFGRVSNNKKRQHLQFYLRNRGARAGFRKHLNSDDPGEEDQMEDIQDY